MATPSLRGRAKRPWQSSIIKLLLIAAISALIAIFNISTAAAAVTHTSRNFASRPEVQQFIHDMAEKHDFDAQQLTELFSQYKSNSDIIAKLTLPFEKATWSKYQQQIVTKQRVAAGVEFWREHQRALAKASKQFGVPPEIIVAILGVETFYGKYKGKTPIVEALATIAFDYPKPKRAAFFKQELEQLLLLLHERNLDPHTLKGSYAGAIGIPQFLPSSYRKYAINLDASDPSLNSNYNSNAISATPDISNNPEAAIASVANYFKSYGWRNGGAVVHKAKVSDNRKVYSKFLSLKIDEPKYTLAVLRKNGINTNARLQPQCKLSLIEVDEAEHKKAHFLVEKNFFVITQYNKSYNYALAVYELSQQLKKQMVMN
jgi:membrane-bound lytic murein transglycosylase B